MAKLPKPPATYDRFSRQFPKLRESWDSASEAGKEGPLDERTARLVKLGISIGSMREGSVHSAVRKALATGLTRDEIFQVAALAATNLGFPSTVAVFTWIEDELEKKAAKDKKKKKK